MGQFDLDLLRDPWVLVLDQDGARHEMSMVEVLEGAHLLRGIVGEIPTQAAAVLRLHLAVLYRALRHDRSREEAQEEWGDWWETGRLPSGRVLDYLAEYEDRFRLFDLRAPFMQVADLKTGSGKTSGLSKLIAEIPDGSQYFTTRAGRGLGSITAAEAARWLVHVHAFDPSGIKSGAVDDPRVKGGRGYPIGTGWTGRLGLILVEGRTLAETLLLNLVHQHPSPEQDAPVWERAPQTGAPDHSAAEPRGVADLMTWQIRRVLLVPDDQGRVVDVLICNGDPVHPRNRQHIEYGTAYRHSPAQEKQHGGTVYMPLEHQPERALWRGLESLLTTATSKGRETAPRLQPPVLGWLSGLRGDILPRTFPLRVRAVGVEYGSNASVIDGVTDDFVVIPAGVLSSPLLRQTAIDAVAATERAVQALRHLAGNLVLAAGGEPTGARERAAETAYSLLDTPFRSWLAGLLDDESADLVDQAARWHVTARRILRTEANRLVSAAGDHALRGRVVSARSGPDQLVDAGLAMIWFDAGLRKSLDLGQPAQARLETISEGV